MQERSSRRSRRPSKGGGGGKPAMAQAGGSDASGIDEALGIAREMLGVEVADVRALGLDIGERRVGVAISDAQMRIATPLDVLDDI